MWTAKIARFERKGTTLTIVVSYVNGEQTYDEVLSVTNGQNDSWLKEAIDNRLKQLIDLDNYQKSIEGNPDFASEIKIEEKV